MIAAGLARLLAPAEIREEVKADEFAEATLMGLRIVAAQQGVPLAHAVRYNGLAGGGPERPVGTRNRLVDRLAHTVGVNWCFLDLVRTARRFSHAGYDDALVEWRNEKACSRGPFRPDGYGIYRHRGRPYGFFLEYDRGLMQTRDFNEKFDAYYDYHAAGVAHREYGGFPTVLIVTRDYGSERRIIRSLLASSVGRSHGLPVLITTREAIEKAGEGPLGPIWRTPENGHRRGWLLDQSTQLNRRHAGRPLSDRAYMVL